MSILVHGGRHTLDDNFRQAGYVQLPEDRDYERSEWEGLRLCKHELDVMESPGDGLVPTPILLELKQAAYADKEDAYELLQAFMVAYEAKLFPPEWVLKGLYERLKKWECANLKGEERTLDSIFRTGTKPKWRERAYGTVKLALHNRYVQLKYYWGMSDGDIFNVLALHVADKGIDGESDVNHAKLIFSERTIRELHKEHKWSNSYKEVKNFILDVQKPSLTQEETENILQDYPEEARKLIVKYKKREPTIDYRPD